MDSYKMVRLVKAHSEGPDTVFEMEVTALSPTTARTRAAVYLFSRNPLSRAGVKERSVGESLTPSSKGFQTYSVTFRVDQSESIRNRLAEPFARFVEKKL